MLRQGRPLPETMSSTGEPAVRVPSFSPIRQLIMSYYGPLTPRSSQEWESEDELYSPSRSSDGSLASSPLSSVDCSTPTALRDLPYINTPSPSPTHCTFTPPFTPPPSPPQLPLNVHQIPVRATKTGESTNVSFSLPLCYY